MGSGQPGKVKENAADHQRRVAITPELAIVFTMDGYSHIIEEIQSDAIALLDEVLPTGNIVVPRKNNANFH